VFLDVWKKYVFFASKVQEVHKVREEFLRPVEPWRQRNYNPLKKQEPLNHTASYSRRPEYSRFVCTDICINGKTSTT
jgi:hypothetical protein